MKPTVVSDTRTVDQNRKLWAMLRDVSRQVEWVVNGQKTLMSEWDWKDVFTASLKQQQRVAQGIDGGWVMLGCHTHNMKKAEMAELIELMLAFGANREPQVVWSDPE